MASTTEHRTGCTDGLEPGAAEVTVATSVLPSPRNAKDSADAPARANPVPLPRAAEPSVGDHSPHPVGLSAPEQRQLGVSGMGRGWIVIGFIATLLAVSLLTVFALHQTMTVQGSVTVHNPWGNLSVDGSCTGAGAYSWLKPGTSVTISDANGKIIGTTTLGGGTPRISGASNYGNYADNCVFPFTLTDVPATGAFYRVGIGNSTATGITFTADELRTSGATVFVG